MSPLVVIVGPTASGKSALAIELALQHNGEIICADSRTVYKGMDIGTAKPSKEDQYKVRHHLLDVVEPNQPFSAAQFKAAAIIAIKDISNRGNIPFLVGGTGLYIDALLFDYSFGGPTDAKKRAELQQLSTDELIKICREKNIETPPNTQNRRHLIRAIEIEGQKKTDMAMRENTLLVGLSVPREVLQTYIIRRTEEMFKHDIINEVNNIAQKYGWESEAMTGSAYRILRPLAEGRDNLAHAFELLVRSDMALAKRQMTWFRRNPFIEWGDSRQLTSKIEQFLEQQTKNKAISG